MVLPASNSNHFFNVSGVKELQQKLKLWIRQNYSDVLGPEINLIDLPNGFELIENKLKKLMQEKKMNVTIKQTDKTIAA